MSKAERPRNGEPSVAAGSERVDAPPLGFLRPGHYRTLDYMGSPEFRAVKDLFEGVPEIGGVFSGPRREAPLP